MSEPTMDLETLRQWIGRRQETVDVIAAGAVRLVQGFFGVDAAATDGDVLPELWHWCFFHQPVRHEDLGRDGHPRLGGFLPPFALPRRMWGAGAIAFERPVLVGRETRKLSTVKSVDIKQGGSGTLGLVRVEHVISQDGATCLTEQQDLVYREPQGQGGQARPGRRSAAAGDGAPPAGALQQVTPDEVMLFRYSALTQNAHRIHYDRDYAVNQEGYPGLVVHGPLTASKLALFAVSQRNGAAMREFSFRGIRPLFCGRAFSIHARAQGGGLELWAEDRDGEIAMTARAVF